jgi:ABC-type transport system substrate-binding protein
MGERNYWQRMQASRLRRRTLLQAAGRAGVGAAGLALVGCGDDDDDAMVVVQEAEQHSASGRTRAEQHAESPQHRQAQTERQAEQQADQVEQEEQAAAGREEDQEQEARQGRQQQQQEAIVSSVVRGGDLRMPTPAQAHDYFDPHRAVFGSTQLWMGFYMNNVVRWRNKAQAIMESDICSLPETPDDETYLFRVDQGARFWDQYPTEGGRLVTSDDIHVNFQRHIDGRDATGAEDGTFPHRDSFAKTASMAAPDDQTFIARTDGPDATWLSIPLGPFGWITSPEAIADFGDRWRDEPTNIDLSSGTGMTIPRSYDPDIGIELERNPGFWKIGSDGQVLPYLDRVTFASMQDPTTIETAYRSREISMGGLTLSSIQVDSLASDFPDHPTGAVPFGYTVVTGWFNFNPDWHGWDGLGNPYLDRRFARAMHLAVDRNLMIDAVYLGSGKLSGHEDTPWFNTYWSIPGDELLTVPGFRPDRNADIKEARALLDASGYDVERPIRLIAPEFWEVTYAGVVETERAMYEDALGIEVQFDLEPFPLMQQRLINGTYPGSGPQWTNAPVEWIRRPPTRTGSCPAEAGITFITTMSRCPRSSGRCKSRSIRTHDVTWPTRRSGLRWGPTRITDSAASRQRPV